MGEVLKITGLTAGYGPLRVLHEIDFKVAEGERVGLVGLNLHDGIERGAHDRAQNGAGHLVAEQAVLTGDTLLGRGTTVVAWPDGSLGDYLASLDRTAELDVAELYPAHRAEPISPGCGCASCSPASARPSRSRRSSWIRCCGCCALIIRRPMSR